MDLCRNMSQLHTALQTFVWKRTFLEGEALFWLNIDLRIAPPVWKEIAPSSLASFFGHKLADLSLLQSYLKILVIVWHLV